MKVFVIIPLDKGYRVESLNPNTKEVKQSGHNTRKNAVDRCLKEIPKDKQFKIVVTDGEVK
jgi:hypothetical protein